MSEETPVSKTKETQSQPQQQGREEGLSQRYCNKTFHSLLRQSNKNGNDNSTKPEPVYLFPRGPCPPPKNLPQAKSHLIDYQVDDSKATPIRKCRYIKDNVILKDHNSDYKETNHYQKRRFQRTETDVSNKYSDENGPNLKKDSNLSRRVKENYTNNPMNYMNKYQTTDYNTQQRTKMAPHTKAVSDYLSSQGVKKAFMSSQPETRTERPSTTSINAVSATTLKSAIQRKQSEPYFARKGFKSYLVGNKNEVAFV